MTASERITTVSHPGLSGAAPGRTGQATPGSATCGIRLSIPARFSIATHVYEPYGSTGRTVRGEAGPHRARHGRIAANVFRKPVCAVRPPR